MFVDRKPSLNDLERPVPGCRVTVATGRNWPKADVHRKLGSDRRNRSSQTRQADNVRIEPAMAGRPRYVQAAFAQTWSGARPRIRRSEVLPFSPTPLDTWSSSGHAYDSATLRWRPFCEF